MHRYIVHDKRISGGRILVLTLRPATDGQTISYNAGQYVSLGFRTGGRRTPVRSFSIISSPTEADFLQVAMRVEGNFTRTAAEIAVGAEAYLQGPFGTFTLNPDYDRNVIMVAGGIGITPFISMLRQARDTRSPIRMTLLYSCRAQADIPFYDEILELERSNPNFRVMFFISDGQIVPEAGARLVSSGIDAAQLRQAAGDRLATTTYFICGPNGFMHRVESDLTTIGVTPDRIITESFAQSSKLFSFKGATAQSKTYVFSAAAIVLAVGGIMLLDLIRYVPKVTAKATAATTSTPTNSAADTAEINNDSTTSDNTSTASNNIGSSSADTSTTPTTTTYSQPTSSVS